MNAWIRAATSSWSTSVMVAMLFGASFMIWVVPAGAEVTIHFRNGRAIVVRDYWYAGKWLMFWRERGTVGVPRAFVAALVETPPPATIGAAPQGVNVGRSAGSDSTVSRDRGASRDTDR